MPRPHHELRKPLSDNGHTSPHKSSQIEEQRLYHSEGLPKEYRFAPSSKFHRLPSDYRKQAALMWRNPFAFSFFSRRRSLPAP